MPPCGEPHCMHRSGDRPCQPVSAATPRLPPPLLLLLPYSVVELVWRDNSWVPAREHRTPSARSLSVASLSVADGSLPPTPRSVRLVPGGPLIRLPSGRSLSLALPSGRQPSLELGAVAVRTPRTPGRAASGIRTVSFNLSSSPEERASMESTSEGTGSRSPRLHRVTESPAEEGS